MFTPKDIENFNKIYHLVKTNGYTLEGAKKALKEKDFPIESSSKSNLDPVIEKLEQIKIKLIQLKV